MSEVPTSSSGASMSEIRRLRITSNGDLSGTRIVDVATGKTPPVVAVDWHAEWGLHTDEPPIATVKVLFTEVDVETDAEIITVCPACGEAGGIEELLWLRAELTRLRDEVARLSRDRAS